MISFFGDKKEYYEFSNFYKTKNLCINGENWMSLEHFFQAQKFSHNKEYYDLIRMADTPNKAFCLAKQKKSRFSSTWYVNKNVYPNIKVNDMIDLSKQNNIVIRSDWESVKIDIMRFIVYQKFLQDCTLRNKLLNTDDLYLCEDSPYDSYWGVGKNKDGNNYLGKILMETRKLLR